ncbi:MAG: hypothetical protein CL920_30640 [Deltaproteobacteria bacterium]|nr:hypothetical protein [Deltaproteobacteria bacterium]|tara:strand:+ start:3448 stop:3633 length:186 start_codon:yes stop_codon:yes gene_type:complete
MPLDQDEINGERFVVFWPYAPYRKDQVVQKLVQCTKSRGGCKLKIAWSSKGQKVTVKNVDV